MAKEEKKVVENPFAGFDILKGPLEAEKTESKIESPEDNIIKEEENDVDEEAFKKAEAEHFKKIEEAKTKKADKTNTEEETTDSNEETTEETNTEEEATEDETGFSFKGFVKHFTDKGILDVDVDKIEDSEEGLEQSIVNTISSGIENWKSKYPEDVHKLLEFVEQGGDPKQFLDVYYSNHSWNGFKIDTEERQKTVIEASLKSLGWTEEEIKDEIDLYEDSGKLEAKAKTHLPKLEKSEKEQKEYLVEAQKQYAEQQNKANEAYWTDLKSTWDKKEDINGFKLTPKIKEQVWNHMSKPVDRKTGKTQLQINNEKNENAQFLYAYLDSLNWDFSKLEKQVATKKTSELRKNLSNFTDNRQKMRSGNTKETDIKDESNPFAGFKNI